MTFSREHGNVQVDSYLRMYFRGRKTNFWLTELVSKKVFQQHRLNSIFFVEEKAFGTLVKMREYFDAPMRINDWYSGGYLNQRGYRDATTTVGAERSEHRYRNAYDNDVKGMSADQQRQIIMDNEALFFDMGVRRIEHGTFAPTWNHMDCQETGLFQKIKIIKPARAIPRAESLSKPQ